MDLSRAERMYQRQQQREELGLQWLDLLALQPGERMADIGSGPGLFSLHAARRVGPTGKVFAIDRSGESLAFLAGRAGEANLANIICVEADAARHTLAGGPADAALVAMMLHHVEDGAALMASAFSMLAPGGRALVAEFHPDGPGEVGPPVEQRLRPELVQAWASAAGFMGADYRQSSPDHYLILFKRP